MLRFILTGILLLPPFLSLAAEPSSRVSMSPELLQQLKQAQPAKGAELAATCDACHSTGGAFPSLAAQLPTYLFKQLQDYKAGHRSSAVMTGLAASLSNQDMINLAAYYGQQSPAKPQPIFSGKQPLLAVQGDSRRILPPCAACHDSSGTGQKLDIPALAGQSEEYLAQTLKDYQSGSRHNDLYGRMRSIAIEMTEAEISEVARYYSAMKR